MAIETGNITQQQKIVLGVLAVVGLIFFYSKVYAPMGGKIKDAKKILQEKQAELGDMKIKAQQLDVLEKEFKLLEEQLKVTEKKLPKTKELPELIRTITKTVEKYNMEVDTLRPGGGSGGQYYMTYPYSLSLATDYHTFGRFFSEIAQLDRIFNIKNLNITTGGSSEDGERSLRASFSIVAYTFKQ
ncbi:MAG: type 4a pilus biogenesis protein PilO [Elusimicrobia bacterium]|jgi:Tfp pilus assembly protein PilO|nr:type 4a pilus biogenesis protein PilO [Elusimicrobiota bacterium]